MQFSNEFQKSLKFVLKHEGEYVNDPNDSGGETKWGISKRAYPKLDIKNLTPEQAADCYWRDYWVASGAVNMVFPFSTVVFDSAINCGVSRVKGWLKEVDNATDLIEKRKFHYYRLVEQRPKDMRYLKGWLRRLNDLKKFVEISEEISKTD